MKLSKRETGEKCPKCSEGWQNFMVISEGLYGCFKCGCVFVPKVVRDAFRAQVRNDIKEAKKEVKEAKINGLICSECGFEAKSKVGLIAHSRKHKK